MITGDSVRNNNQSIVHIPSAEEQRLVGIEETLKVTYVDLLFNGDCKSGKHRRNLVADSSSSSLSEDLVHNINTLASQLSSQMSTIGKMDKDCTFRSLSGTSAPHT